ncbi:MAG: peptidoglycan recognition protein family protein [Planctomycetota bacterium]|jgi:hypothetical protein
MKGVVNHITAGHFSLTNMAVNVMLGRGNSWPITIYRDGHAEQHFALEAVAWQAGTKSNYRHIGIEHECRAWEDLTIKQRAKSVEVQSEICRIRGWPAIVRNVTGYEHNQFMATRCPNGKIPWAEIKEGTEVPITQAEFDKMLKASKAKFAPPGHGGATLIQWLTSYDRHRKGYGGRRCTHAEFPIFVKKTGTTAVYMVVPSPLATGNMLVHMSSPAVLNQLRALYGGGRVKNYAASNAIWKLPKLSLS